MINLINKFYLSNILIIFCTCLNLTLLFACSRSNTQSESLEVEEGINIRENPLGAIQKVAEYSKNADILDSKTDNQEPVQPISFKELINYLPDAPQGWTAKPPKGETNSLGNYSISQVNQTYTNKDKEISVSIFDWAFNSALYTPFLLTTEFSQESTDGYNKGIKIGNIPGREEYTYATKEGSLNLLVNQRFFIQIDGSNIEDTELREWWQLIDHPSLDKIANK